MKNDLTIKIFFNKNNLYIYLNNLINKKFFFSPIKFQEYEKKDFYRKLDKIVGLYNFLNEEEVKTALEDSNNDEVNFKSIIYYFLIVFLYKLYFK